MRDNFKLVDINNGNITIVKDDDAFLIKCFRELIRKDSGMPGDSDGKKKLKSARELAYIIYMNDPIRSPGLRAGYIGAALKEDAIRQLELPQGWQPSELLVECEKEYRLYIEGISTNVYRNILASLGTSNRLVHAMNEKMNEVIDGGLTNEDINEMSKQIASLTKITSEYEAQIESLKKAEYNARKERTEIKKAKGGKEILASMDPTNAVK